MQAIIDFCVKCANWFWGLPILILIIGGGLYMSIRLGFPQVTKIGYICSQTFGKMFAKKQGDGVSPFAAACSALGASIGASNIVGVPVAIALGGPGAIFWMWIIAIVGCCTKYVEIALAMKYREKNEAGEWVGGSFSYVKQLFGGKKLGYGIAIFCAFFTMIAGLPSVASQALSAAAQVATFGRAVYDWCTYHHCNEPRRDTACFRQHLQVCLCTSCGRRRLCRFHDGTGLALGWCARRLL